MKKVDDNEILIEKKNFKDHYYYIRVMFATFIITLHHLLL